MNFLDWQSLKPVVAASRIHKGIMEKLSPSARRAAVAWLPNKETLTRAFHEAGRAPEGALRGVPYLLKDLFDFPGLPTFAGSNFLPQIRPTPPHAGALVGDLKTHGAVFAGKAHLHEFAYGITGENPHYGDCEHPRFPGRTTGGSSSGSAALVAADLVPFAIGTDTGGSVRLPAAFCGIYGFRAAPRDRWISDAFPLAPGFDTAGWFTSTAHDMTAVLKTLLPSLASVHSLRGCYLDMPGLDPEVDEACRRAAARFCPPADALTRESLQHAFVSSPETYNVIVADEAWSIHQSWAARFKNRYDPAVWARLNRVHDLTDTRRTAAQADLAANRAAWRAFFESNDFLVMPASPSPALTKAECTLANRNRIFALTTPASLGGVPVLTIPVALPSGLSTGLQIIATTPNSPVFTSLLKIDHSGAGAIASIS